MHVIWVSGWKDADVKESKGWGPFLKTQNNWSEDENTVFVFDEAQLSYTDGALWNDFFKCMHDYDNRRAITFASYGNASSIFSIDDTPFFSADEARVSLLPISHEDNLPAAGLFFTRAEFDELVSTHYPTTEYLFHPSFLDKVFGITEGHVGAMRDFMNIVLSDDVCTLVVFKRSRNMISSSSHIVNSNSLRSVTLGRYFNKESVYLCS